MADDIAKATALVAAGTLPSTAISVLKNNPFPILAEKGHLS
jgi:histidine ammonia-lyase